MPRTLVIIPSYNEEENIVRLIRALRALDAKPDVLVVDDGSDKTAELVQAESVTDPGIRLRKREGKGGRGTAVLDGIRIGLDEGYDVLVEMDADFSHHPEALPALLALSEPNTVVIGSRYLPGSRIENWPLSRRVFSRLANLYARLILGIPIHDYTNGYRAYGRDAAAKLRPEDIRSKGYIVLSEISWQLHKAGCRFRETPIVFVNRARGASNFSFKEVAEALTAIWRIRFRKQ